ncbi:MAG: tricarboxylate carrier family protein [Actinomycetota bacterium]|nr:tricarboxylate carrier family protein [Actinomycetota bacterium]
MSAEAAGPDGDPWAALEQAALKEAAQRDNAVDTLAGGVKPGKRERIVLAKRRSSRRVVRTLAELEDQTSVGEVLVRQLVRVQLILSIRLMLITVVLLVGIPLAFLLFPSLGTITVLGLRLPWLLLGLAVYPFFVAVAWSYNRSADRNEQDFAEMVEN